MTKRSRELKDEVGYHDLLADLKKAGCPACHGADRAAWRYLDSLLWEFVNDPGIRAGIRASRGFCRDHSQMALAVAAERSGSLGMAILYEDLVGTAEDAAARVTRARWRGGSRGRKRSVWDGLAPRAGCPPCQSANRVADNYLRILATCDPESSPAVAVARPGHALCFPHLAWGLAHARSRPKAEQLLATFDRGTEELRAELREYIRKQDYRFRSEGLTDREASSWRRAVYRLVGEPAPRRPPER